MKLLDAAREFFVALWHVLPRALWAESVAWLGTFTVLVIVFKAFKQQVRPGLMKLDDGVRTWAKTLRYRAAHPDATRYEARRAARLELAGSRADVTPDLSLEAPSRVLPATLPDVLRDLPQQPDDSEAAHEMARELDDEDSRERVPLTWFFRFWTNLASAPALCTFSLGAPLIIYALSRNLLGKVPAWLVQGHSAPELAWRDALPWLMPGLCYSGAMLMSWVLKRVFKRLRPQRKAGAFGHKLQDGSFPSGHSLTSFCFWVGAVWTMAFIGAPALFTLPFALWATAVVLLTGLSRIYLGVHFPSDVLGGYTIGLAWCVTCLTVLPRVLMPAEQSLME